MLERQSAEKSVALVASYWKKARSKDKPMKEVGGRLLTAVLEGAPAAVSCLTTFRLLHTDVKTLALIIFKNL